MEYPSSFKTAFWALVAEVIQAFLVQSVNGRSLRHQVFLSSEAALNSTRHCSRAGIDVDSEYPYDYGE